MGQRFLRAKLRLRIRLTKRYRRVMRNYARPFSPARPHRLRSAVLGPPAARAAAEPAADPLDDLRLFAMTFAGGLVFFGTYLA